MLIYWAVLQLFGGFVKIGAEPDGGVAFWAHVGGIIAGVILVKIFERPDRLLAHHWQPDRVGWR